MTEPIHFDKLSRYCIDKFRSSHPELSPQITDEEIELAVYRNATTVVYTLYDAITHFLNKASEKISVEKKMRLQMETIQAIQGRLLFFIDRDKAIEVLCGSDADIEAFLSHETAIYLEVFKEMVAKCMRLFYQTFVDKFSVYSSYDSLLYCHQTINKMLLKARGRIGLGNDFQDTLEQILIKQCENLLAFYEKELDRVQMKYIPSKSFAIIKNKPDSTRDSTGLAAKYPSNEGKDIPITFEDLFIPPYNKDVDDFVNILYKCDPQVIRNDCKWIEGANNGILRIFLKALATYNIIKYSRTRKTYGKIFAEKFDGIDYTFIDSRAKDNSLTHLKCEKYFKEEIDKCKQAIDSRI